MAYYCNVPAIRVDLGETGHTFRFGEELVDVPAGTLESMLRLDQAVSEPPQAEPAAEEPMETEVQPSWQETPVAKIGLDAKVVKLLGENGLATVGDVLRYGAEHGNLTALDGIGDATEAKIKEAIERLAK